MFDDRIRKIVIKPIGSKSLLCNQHQSNKVGLHLSVSLAMILQDETLINLTEEDELGQSSPAPPTKVVTVKQHFTRADHNEMLSLAQQKFDQLRKKNRERVSSVRYGKGFARRRPGETQEEMKISQLLSSLLYLSLMMHRVDDMKKILEMSNGALYNEWFSLFDTMHSPLFHLCERKMHNDRVKKIFNRKRKYRELYEQAKASLATVEATSSELSQALSRMSEENLKNQVLLEQKCGVECKLSAATKEVDNLQARLDIQEKHTVESKTEYRKLEVIVNELRIERAQFTKQIQTQDKSTTEIKNELSQLKVKFKENETQCSNAEKALATGEKEIESLQTQLKLGKESHKCILEEKEQQFQLLKASSDHLQSSLMKIQEQMAALHLKFAAEKDDLQRCTFTAKKEAEVISAKLKKSEEALERSNDELVSKNKSLEQAFEASRIEQKKLREMIVTKDAEMNRSNEKLRSIEMKFLKSDTSAKCAAKLQEEENSKLKDTVSCLEAKLNYSDIKNQTLTEEIARTLASGAKLQEEKNALSEESMSCSAENKRLKEVLETMKSSMEQSAESASKCKENVEAKANEIQRELLDVKLQLAKSQAENDILKSSAAETVKALADARAQIFVDEKETCLLQKCIDKLKKENGQLSKKLDSTRDSMIKFEKATMEKQILSERKMTELRSQLDAAVNEPRCASIPVQHKENQHELILPEDEQNSANKLEMLEQPMTPEKDFATSMVTDMVSIAVNKSISS